LQRVAADLRRALKIWRLQTVELRALAVVVVVVAVVWPVSMSMPEPSETDTRPTSKPGVALLKQKKGSDEKREPRQAADRGNNERGLLGALWASNRGNNGSGCNGSPRECNLGVLQTRTKGGRRKKLGE
jgi:hypothetical protein